MSTILAVLRQYAHPAPATPTTEHTPEFDPAWLATAVGRATTLTH